MDRLCPLSDGQDPTTCSGLWASGSSLGLSSLACPFKLASSGEKSARVGHKRPAGESNHKSPGDKTKDGAPGCSCFAYSRVGIQCCSGAEEGARNRVLEGLRKKETQAYLDNTGVEAVEQVRQSVK